MPSKDLEVKVKIRVNTSTTGTVTSVSNLGSSVTDVTAPVPAPAPTVAPTPAPTPAPAPLPPVNAPAVAYPFGSRLIKYVGGSIKPALVTEAAMDDVLRKQYTAWKAHSVKPCPGVTGGLAVQYSDANFLTVSEGMGYGMLLAVLFAGHDPGAQALFDGLLTTVRAKHCNVPGGVGEYYKPYGAKLMDWKLYANGTSAGDGWNAMDGDEDIAMALVMADKQWGSGGKWNYKAEAIATINEMKGYNFAADGTTKGLKYGHVSRVSDYMLGHFRSYGRITGDAFWTTKAVPRAQQLLNLMQTQFSAVGLVPDFIINTDTANPIPSTGNMGDGNMNENRYWWNSCRVPWRLASDYLTSGDTATKASLTKIIDFFVKQAGSPIEPYNIGDGYMLDGTKATSGSSPAYHGPILAGACTDMKYQAFADAMWAWNARSLTTGYYDGEIQLLSMVVASGNWWQP